MRQYFIAAVVAVSFLAAVSVGAQTPAPDKGTTAPAATPPTGQSVAPAPAAAPGPFQSPGQANILPDGEGKEIVAVACTQCHGPSVFLQLRMGETAWRNRIYDMVLRGAQVSPDEIDRAVHYMATAFGPGVPFPGPAAPAVTLADGAGKEIVEGGCALCHGLDRVVATKRMPDQWKRIVDRMVFFGAPLSDDQQKTALDYLTAQYSPPQTAAK